MKEKRDVKKHSMKLPCGCVIYGEPPIVEGMYLCQYHRSTLSERNYFQAFWEAVDASSGHYVRRYGGDGKT